MNDKHFENYVWVPTSGRFDYIELPSKLTINQKGVTIYDIYLTRSDND